MWGDREEVVRCLGKASAPMRQVHRSGEQVNGRGEGGETT